MELVNSFHHSGRTKSDLFIILNTEQGRRYGETRPIRSTVIRVSLGRNPSVQFFSERYHNTSLLRLLLKETIGFPVTLLKTNFLFSWLFETKIVKRIYDSLISYSGMWSHVPFSFSMCPVSYLFPGPIFDVTKPGYSLPFLDFRFLLRGPSHVRYFTKTFFFLFLFSP